jgi:hypothetical protein
MGRKQHQFQPQDITIAHWAGLCKIGLEWLEAEANEQTPDLTLERWTPLLPAMDLWLTVSASELHYVSKLVPTLDWTGGLLGVRMRLEPSDAEQLYKEFTRSCADVKAIENAAAATPPPAGEEEVKVGLWPADMMDFLSRRLAAHLMVRAYPLDPTKLIPPVKSVAKPQKLDSTVPALEGDQLTSLVRVNEIIAQRGFGEEQNIRDDDGSLSSRSSNKLSQQLRSYYRKHLDPSEFPEPKDYEALRAIAAAQNKFDEKLTNSFQAAFYEVEGLGYPGVTDPRPHVATQIRPVDGLNHPSAITFEIAVVQSGGAVQPVVRLPEDNNGLGYQNLISMIFRLMAFRDAWMRVGKASRTGDGAEFEPLHLVLVEEPEAHLHAQVQQVFIKKAYDVLRAHSDLGDSGLLRTQLVVSTHSGHVAHELDYSCLRYFRRLPAGMDSVPVPISIVVNLSDTFGGTDETARFVKRYLRTQHADLFFADALTDAMLKLMAWQMKNIGKPSRVIVIMRTERQQAGKGLLLNEALLKIYGDAGFVPNSTDQVLGRFNDIIVGRAYVFLDEAMFFGDRRAADAIKSLSTTTLYGIETKGLPTIQCPVGLNFWMATNHPVAAFIEERDARYWVLNVSEHRVGDTGYFDDVLKELENGGREAFAHYLLNLDVSGFVPLRDVPKNNDAKREMIKRTINPYDARKWLEECCVTGQLIGARTGDPDLQWTAWTRGAEHPFNVLSNAYTEWQKGVKSPVRPEPTPIGSLGEALTHAGFGEKRTSTERRRVLPDPETCLERLYKLKSDPDEVEF